MSRAGQNAKSASTSKPRILATRASSLGAKGLVRLLIAVSTALVLALTVASPASAASTRSHDSSFGSFPTAGDPQGLTVDQSNGDIYAYSPTTVFDSKIYRFDSTGAPKNFTSGPDAGTNTLTGIFGDGGPGAAEVAIDRSGGATDGDIYVANFFGVNVYDNSGTQVDTLTGGSTPDGYYSEPCGVAVDQTDGRVYVGDYGNHVYRYTPSGAHATETDYSGGITTPTDTCAVAAHAGQIYAADKDNLGPVRHFAASDFAMGPPPSPSSTLVDADATALAIDPSSGDLYVDEGDKISVFEADDTPLYSFGSASDFGTDSAGVAVKAGGSAYVADRTANEIDVYGPVTQTRAHDSSFATGSFPAGDPQGLTVDQSNGDIYAYSPTTVFDSKIYRFDSTGAPKNFTSGPDAGTNTLTGIFGDGGPGAAEVAIDRSGGATDGDIYVANFFGVNVYDNSGTQVDTLTGGSTPDGYYSEPCGVAVDQTDGRVYVGDYGNHVYRYTPSGAHATETDYSGGITTPTDTCAVAAHAGQIYAADKDNLGPVRHFAASDFAMGPPPSPSSTLVDADATALAIDPSSGDLYVDEGDKISVFEADDTPLYSFGSASDFGTDSAGVAVKAGGSAYVADRTANEIDVYGAFAPAHPPRANTNPATAVHHTTAVLNGDLDPRDDAGITGCFFDYGPTNAYGATVPCTEATPITTPADVSAQLGGLTPGQQVHFRLHLNSTSSGDITGEDQTFTPDPFPVVHAPVTSFGKDGTSSSCFDTCQSGTGLAALAFDQSNRHVYALSYAPLWVRGFDASAPPAYPTLSGFDPLTPPSSLNGDPHIATGNGGNVFVAAQGATSNPVDFPPLVYGYAPSGAPLSGNFPIDPRVTPGGAAGSPAELGGIATDSSGDIWISNTQSDRILHYGPTGAFIATLDVSTHGTPSDLAFDSAGNLYVIQVGGIWRYTAASSYTSASLFFNPGNSARSFGVDPSNDHFYVARPTAVDEYDPGGALLSTFATGIPNAQFQSVAIDASNHYAYVADAGSSGKVRVFAPGLKLEGPTLTPGDPSAITGTSATLNAKVDPEGFPVTDCHFEYGTDTSYGQTAPCSPAPGAGSGDVAVHADLSGLPSGTAFHYRIVASNANNDADTTGTSTGPDQTLTTLGPQIHSTTATQITRTSAKLGSQINPAGKVTSFHFQYGPTASYGQTTPDGNLPSDTSDRSATRDISGLTPGTTYHYRVIATNPDGTSVGPDRTFATYPAAPAFAACSNDALRTGAGARLPDCRAYEQATPVDKHGNDAIGRLNFVQAAADGHAVDFFSTGNLPTTGGSSNQPIYLATRGASSWSSDGLLPATSGDAVAHDLGWDDNFDTALSYTHSATANTSTLDLYDTATRARQQAGSFPQLTSTPKLNDIADDTSHFTFQSQKALLPGAISGKENLYDLDHGTLTLAGRVPAFPATACDDSGGPACTVSAAGAFAGSYDTLTPDLSSGGARQYFYTQNTLSDDGSRVFFTEADTGRLFMREGGTSTTQLNADQGGNDPNPGKPASFLAATPDGATVYFSSCEQLTPDSTAVSTPAATCLTDNQGQDLYAYDTASGDLTDLTVDSTPTDPKGAAVRGLLGASDDGSYVYFAARGVLAPGALAGQPNLYLYQDGDTTFVATLGPGGPSSGDSSDGDAWRQDLGAVIKDTGLAKSSRVASDGTLLFASTKSLTGYDNTDSGNDCSDGNASGTPCTELYRYHPGDPGPVCVSCNPTGAAPRSNASLSTRFRGGGLTITGPDLNADFLTRNISADGDTVFFDSADALLAADTNGVSDVYEWEAEGSGSCDSTGVNGGCLYLLTTGTSTRPSFFADASASGGDAFFFTDSQLVPQDADQLVDVYDARVNGGLPSQHPENQPGCTGDACQGPASPPPADPGSGSSSFAGPGNQGKDHTPASGGSTAKKKCKKGKKGKKCRKARKRSRTANTNGRAGK